MGKKTEAKDSSLQKEAERLDLANRLALRPKEAAQALGVSERAFQDHLLPRCPKFYAGRSVVIPKALFERFLERLALDEQCQTETTAAELLAATEADLDKPLAQSS